jgi:type VI secretion system secreted protein Hcp
MAAVDYFLKIAGIDGETKDDKLKAHIDLESWSWGETNAGSMGRTGAGGGSGKVSAQDFHFVMQMNKASAKLLSACATGDHIKDATLICRKAGKNPQVFLQIKLSEVLVSSYQTGGSAHADIVPTDQISLNFAKIEFEYGEQDEKGTVAGLKNKAGYNFQTNKSL